jgi:hypothetical protein
MSAVGRESGIEVDGEVFHAVWLRQGRIFRMEDHLTERGVKRALGLPNPTILNATRFDFERLPACPWR